MDLQHKSSTPSRVWLPVGLATALLLSGVAVVAKRIGGLAERLDRSESARIRLTTDMSERLDGMRSELSEIREDVGDAFVSLEENHELAKRLEDAEAHLGSIGTAIEAQSFSLEKLQETQASFAPDIAKELQDRDERLVKRYESLSELAENAQRAASDTQERVARLDQSLSTPPNLTEMWRDLVGPVVQLAGDASVGSGVLLPSKALPDGGYSTLILTAWHVVRDIQGDPPDLDKPVPVQIYAEDGSTRNEKAKLLVHDPKLDAALLEMITPDALDFGASLALPSHLAETRIFEPVVAVGCPLGNDPIPTRGEVATCSHMVDGESYWMINAPTYIGNSGGGIFDSKTHELLGIFSKIYTHGSLRPTIVPHMGLVTPMTRIYAWLDEVGYGELIPVENTTGEAAHANQ